MSLVLKIDGYGRKTAGTITLSPQSFVIDNTSKADGYYPIGTITTLNATLCFINGLEANITYDNYSNINPNIDVLVNISGPNYPTSMDAYYNGSAFGVNASPLGNLEINDIVKIYYVDI